MSLRPVNAASPPRQAGMTLLELMVAITVFAAMSVMAYQGLIAIATSDETVTAQNEAMRDLRFAVETVVRDLRQAVPRPIRGAYGDPLPALAGGPVSLSLTRAGWTNPTARLRSELERLDYQIDGDKLLRRSWPVLDRTPSNRPDLHTLVTGVNGLAFRYMDQEQEWHEEWPPKEAALAPSEGPPWPRAIAVTLSGEEFGVVERIVSLASEPLPLPREPDGAGNDGRP